MSGTNFGLKQRVEIYRLSEPEAMNDLKNPTLPGGPLFTELGLLPELVRFSVQGP